VRILLPPSETKRRGGIPRAGSLDLSFPVQDAVRADLQGLLETLCRDNPTEAARVLKLGPKSVGELANNVFANAPVMPAIDRYTGVLYSATDVANWTAAQRTWAGSHVFIHSALFGIVSSADEIPAYRFSHDTRLGGLALSAYWGSGLSEALTQMAAGDWVLDARSAGYRDLGSIPEGVRHWYLDVVSANGGKALNHFNKIHKGRLVATLVADSPSIHSPSEFANWSNRAGLSVRITAGAITLAI